MEDDKVDETALRYRVSTWAVLPSKRHVDGVERDAALRLEGQERRHDVGVARPCHLVGVTVLRHFRGVCARRNVQLRRWECTRLPAGNAGPHAARVGTARASRAQLFGKTHTGCEEGDLVSDALH